LKANPSLLAQPVLVLGQAAWPGGVVGIVASRLVERYRKPAILFSTPPGEPARGSARSIEGLNITAAIAAQSDLLLNFGGHPMAAGLALDAEKLPEFQKRLSKTVAGMMGEVDLEGTLAIDGWLDLEGITLELAEALESLAPYGPGNEKLTLATHALTLQSKAAIGRNKEHLKLVVTDEAGQPGTVLWWNGAGETSPEGCFDLAYTVRASDWRGSRQVQMEFIDFRNTDEKPIEVSSRKIELVDHRNAPKPLETLATIDRSVSTLVWAEAGEKKAVGGVDRDVLTPAETLVIWTTPPSSRVLRAVLEKVRPHTVVLFAVTEPVETPEAFLGRLAGLLKYAINHRQGQLTHTELEAATAQRGQTVRRGLDWLVAQGEIKIIEETGEGLVVTAGTSLKDTAGSAQAWSELQSLLAETAAYRAHFKRADKDSLLDI
jgi:single-stranded-DNA-specific exonuclease